MRTPECVKDGTWNKAARGQYWDSLTQQSIFIPSHSLGEGSAWWNAGLVSRWQSSFPKSREGGNLRITVYYVLYKCFFSTLWKGFFHDRLRPNDDIFFTDGWKDGLMFHFILFECFYYSAGNTLRFNVVGCIYLFE